MEWRRFVTYLSNDPCNFRDVRLLHSWVSISHFMLSNKSKVGFLEPRGHNMAVF